MVVQTFTRLVYGAHMSRKGVHSLSSYHGKIVRCISSNGRRSSSLGCKIPALTLATLMTVKFPSIMATVHDTGLEPGYCSSYSSSCGTRLNQPSDTQSTRNSEQDQKISPSQDTKKTLSSLQYHVTQEAGTERAFTGKYYDHWEKGIYTCVVCGASLFGSESKYNSGSGWPSFHSPYSAKEGDESSDEHNVVTLRDSSHGMVRNEVRCKKCGSHLGHVFDDGVPPSGLRYCINSAALHFQDQEE